MTVTSISTPSLIASLMSSSSSSPTNSISDQLGNDITELTTTSPDFMLMQDLYSQPDDSFLYNYTNSLNFVSSPTYQSLLSATLTTASSTLTDQVSPSDFNPVDPFANDTTIPSGNNALSPTSTPEATTSSNDSNAPSSSNTNSINNTLAPLAYDNNFGYMDPSKLIAALGGTLAASPPMVSNAYNTTPTNLASLDISA
ncbi:MAG: hypothetical protein E6713_10620 [Sporomusaceae bacterium]|nr:hypothetical protein [Sporomusaceae bacterium]